MRISKLLLQAFGPFTGLELDFGPAAKSLVLICGPNEAGKSATLRAISDLRFGIPIQSADNFVHANADLRIGGVFVDAGGREYRVIRRKGRTSTLAIDDGSGDTSAARPVSADVEALITSGLSRDEYEMMFGLDHQRLRDGGEALRKGEGDVGAALFEASAGVRSIPEVLDRMDQHARTFFMPGARGKNAAINSALRSYDEKSSELRKSLVRPAQWTDLHKQYQTEVDEVARIDQQTLQLNGRLLLIKELTAVAPLLGALEQAVDVLEELKDARILADSASVDRTAASTALAVAQGGAAAAAAEAERLNLVVEGISPDARILEAAAAIERLVASAEALDAARRESAEATIELQVEGLRLQSLCSKIDASLVAENILRAVPTGASRANVESRLRELERSELALRQHRDSAPSQVAAASADAAPALPTPEARMALRAVQGEVTRSEETIKKLASLPGEIEAAGRSLGTMLGDLGLASVEELRIARPLTDTEISSAVSEGENNATRQRELEKRISEIGTAIEVATASRLTLLADGAVPTRDDVYAARQHRETGWSLIRSTYIEAADQPVDQYTKGRPLPEVYQEAVKTADELVDGLASDTERAAQLQARTREQAKLDEDLQKLKLALEELQEARRKQEDLWHATLDAAYLPRRSAKALAEWQALLRRARETGESVQAKLHELKQAEAAESGLRSTLRAAIVGTAAATPTADSSLGALVAMCVEVEAEIKRRERAIDTSAGERSEREKQERIWTSRERELVDRLAHARAGVSPLLQGLLLSGTPEPAVVRARLDELDALSAVGQKLTSADTQSKKCQERIAAIEQQVRQIASACGEPEVVNPRLTVDNLSRRMLEARDSEKRLALARQALESAREHQREQLELAGRQTILLKALCVSAGVEDPGLLPEVEDRSRRKREAQAEADRCRLYIGNASTRPVAELKTLLQESDAALLGFEEEKCFRELRELQDAQAEARARESEAKRALDAIDSDDAAAALREEMEVAIASVRANVGPWMRSRLAHALMAEALKRFRDRAQGPMLKAASDYFRQMTGAEFLRLLSEDVDDELVLVAERKNGARITVDKMSEGTRDQLYLALRLAALEARRSAGANMPLILDDVLATSDDHRAALILKALAEFSRNTQVIVLTHHQHLVGVAQRNVPDDLLSVLNLQVQRLG